MSARRLMLDVANTPLPSGYSLSSRWQENVEVALAAISNAKEAIEIARYALTMFDLELKPVTAEHRTILDNERSHFIGLCPELATICESSLLPADNVSLFDGVAYSSKMTQVFSYYADIKKGVGDISSVRTILEIGSGYGRLARIMHLLDRGRRYFLVDIPESLIFSYAFLRFNFPDEDILIIGSVQEAAALRRMPRFILCPVQFVESLDTGPVDLVVNTYSFAEMTQSCVDFFMRQIEWRIRPRFFYSLNSMFCDKSLYFDTGGLHGEANEMVLKLEGGWWPRLCDLRFDRSSVSFRVEGSIVLERHEGSEVVDALLVEAEIAKDTAARLVYLYFAALRMPDVIPQFRIALKKFSEEAGFAPNANFDLDRIGEIRGLEAFHPHDQG